jgi:hypothetical protein
LGGLAVLVFEKTVESEVYLQDREVLEILCNTLHREDFFNEGVFPYYFGALYDAALITFFGIDLSQPAGISVASRAQPNLGVKAAETKFLYVSFDILGHVPSLNQKGDCMHYRITKSYLKFLKVW